jgi:hypothetical protein
MTKEVWIVVSTVPYPDRLDYGKTEYRFSNMRPGPSTDSRHYNSYADLREGLKEHSGYTIHWVGERKEYKVRVEVRETREVFGTIIVYAHDKESAIANALNGSFDDFDEDGCDYNEWKIVDASDPEMQ